LAETSHDGALRGGGRKTGPASGGRCNQPRVEPDVQAARDSQDAKLAMALEYQRAEE
jgi:hypothetical protein